MRAGRLAPTIVILAAALSLLRPPPAAAQAWVPEQGGGSLTTTYQFVAVQTHLNRFGEESDALGRTHTDSVTTSFEYGITDRLALDAEVAYIGSKYIGTRPHGPADTGHYHPTFQDAYVGVRYNVLVSPVVLTPFVGVVLPTHHYETRGHSAVGKDFRELQFGLNAGRTLAPLVRNAYVEARYAYAVLKRFEGLNLNHSNLDWEAGWQARRSLSFRFLGDWHVTHGGLAPPLDAHIDDHLREFHDRATRAKYVHLGVGAEYSLGRAFDIHGTYVRTVYGRSTHATRGFALGFSWSFSRGLEVPQL